MASTETRNCLVKKLWENWTPYVQIIGYAPVIGSLLAGLYLLSVFVSNTQAYGQQIRDLQTWQSATQQDIAAIRQEVHDIHEVVVVRP